MMIMVVLMMVISTTLPAQDSMKFRPVQFTFVPPVSSNGVESGKYINNFSLNLIAGYNGGVDGVEIGSFMNINKTYVKGFQVAGFANINGGYADGMLISGFTNVVGDSAKGLQVAGFLNLTGDKAAGAQIAGFANLVAGNNNGLQISGFSNISAGKVNGTQIAGFANIATDEVEGVQVSGFVNMARKVKGTQIGFVNIADTVEGASIGFLSLVRKGYHTLELNVTESMFTTAALKIGTQRFYNIFTAGIQPVDDLRWGVGYGIGTMVPFSNRLSMNFDLTAYHINERGYWTITVNEYGKLNANLNVKLAEHLTITAGPSLNIMVSDYRNKDANTVGSGFPPYDFYNHTNGYGYNTRMWAGANVGIRF